MKMYNPFKYKKTNFKAGGLLSARVPLSNQNILTSDKKFIAPRKLDFRDMCLPTNNQGSAPHCAGYATAGYIEIQKWKKLHYPEQLDGDAIYAEAKKIDSHTGDGTSLDYAVIAAKNMGLIDGNLKFIQNTQNDIMFTIHTHSACIGGFNITDEWNVVDRNTGEISDFDYAQTIGGHAVLLCGYDTTGVYVQNSWGTDWGIYGFGLIPWKKVEKQFMYGVVIE
jgi:hypothetical protein